MKRRIIALKPLIFWLIYAGVIVVTVVIDQLTKHFIEIAVANNGGRIRILGDWLTLVWTTNPVGMGGLFRGLDERYRHILFFVMTLVGLPIFGVMLWRSRTRSVWGQVAFAFMIGGTIGNAIDRLFLPDKNGLLWLDSNRLFFSGAVRDFVQVENFFGIFNMADSFLVVGVILALLAIVVFDYDSLVSTIIDERKTKGQTQVADGLNNRQENVDNEQANSSDQNDENA